MFKTDLQRPATDRSEQPPVKLRRRWATPHLLAPLRDDACDDDAPHDGGDDEPSAMLRRSAKPSQLLGTRQVRLLSPGSARGPAPPALRRTAPQSTGKQYASYPSPSRFLDGDFANRLTFAQAIAMPLCQTLENTEQNARLLRDLRIASCSNGRVGTSFGMSTRPRGSAATNRS